MADLVADEFYFISVLVDGNDLCPAHSQSDSQFLTKPAESDYSKTIHQLSPKKFARFKIMAILTNYNCLISIIVFGRLYVECQCGQQRQRAEPAYQHSRNDN